MHHAPAILPHAPAILHLEVNIAQWSMFAPCNCTSPTPVLHFSTDPKVKRNVGWKKLSPDRGCWPHMPISFSIRTRAVTHQPLLPTSPYLKRPYLKRF